jgi:hypothetical protein
MRAPWATPSGTSKPVDKLTSDGGTGKTTEEMQDIATFSGADWNIIGVDDADDRNDAYTWNTVDGDTYPFLSWQPAV